ncbi:MAG: ACT domain-containing protein [Clostridiales bacterium]|nr:ACT domain-containing protein [Clostridiales bacterium]MDD6872356.1 ACT domain-containing protein [Clostridiales bacterium]MDD7367202.1 ACT domain-containing protein [Clostridiales bacterium]MDY2871711.1 ACT domain-containing protein [Eubacteriales bacterium]
MKAIISVLGGDRPGIIAEISGCLYRHNLNILDITQTILSGYFTMVMMVDLAGMNVSYAEMTAALNELGEKLGLEIRMQRSEIFDAMHRL